MLQNIKVSVNISDFNQKLMEMLASEEEEDSNEYCLISNSTLDDNPVKLSCGHKFNYGAILSEIKNQKQIYNNYETQRLRGNEIKCPYCRSIQNGLIEWRENYEKVQNVNWPPSMYYLPNTCIYVFKSGKKKGLSCGKKCLRDYCKTHKKTMENRKQKEAEKIKKQKAKLEEKQKAKLEEKQKKKQQQKLNLEEKVALADNLLDQIINNNKVNTIIPTCKYVFKRGKNKGKCCTVKKIQDNGFCKRHQKYYVEQV